MVWQKRYSVDCALAMTAMIMSYYEDRATVKDLKKSIKVYKGGTWMPQHGIHFLDGGYSVEIVSQSTEVFTLKDRHRSQENLERKLRRLEKEAKEENKRGSGGEGISYPLSRVFNYYALFMEKGGRIRIKIPTEEDIRTEIKAGRPVGANLRSDFLLRNTPRNNNHAMVIVGIEGKNILVQDPYPCVGGGLMEYHIDDFMYGLHAASGELLCVQKDS